MCTGQTVTQQTTLKHTTQGTIHYTRRVKVGRTHKPYRPRCTECGVRGEVERAPNY